MWNPIRNFFIDILFVLIAVIFVTSCGGKAGTGAAVVMPPKSVWSFAPESIQIQYLADKMLNVFENVSHTLLLAVYQLDNVNTFNDLARSQDGLERLLQVQRFDASVVGMDKIIVQPGEGRTVVLNRAENARWIGIVAGYYSLELGQVSRIFHIPVITETKGIYGFRKTESRVGQMTIKLLLGPNALQERGVEVR